MRQVAVSSPLLAPSLLAGEEIKVQLPSRNHGRAGSVSV